MFHVPDLQPCLKLWVRLPMPAAPCESIPAWGRSCGGDFSLGKMSGHEDLPHRRPGLPSPLLAVLCTSLSAPQGSSGMCSTGWELLLEEAAPPLPPLAHLGPRLCLGHGHRGSSRAGSHWRALSAPSRLLIPPRVPLPAFPRHPRVLWKHPHRLFLLCPCRAGKGRLGS